MGTRRTSEILVLQLSVMCTCLCIVTGCSTVSGTEGKKVGMDFQNDFFLENTQSDTEVAVRNESDNTLLISLVNTDGTYVVKEQSPRVMVSFYHMLDLSPERRHVLVNLQIILLSLRLHDTGKYTLYAGKMKGLCIHLSVEVPVRSVTLDYTLQSQVPEYGQVRFTCMTSPSNTPVSMAWYIQRSPYDASSLQELDTPRATKITQADSGLAVTTETVNLTFDRTMNRARIGCRLIDNPNIVDYSPQIVVLVPLRSVTVNHTINPSNDTIATSTSEVPEYGKVDLTCITSPSSASATVTWYMERPPYDVIGLQELNSPNQTTYRKAGYKDMFTVTEAKITVTFDRRMNGARIKCQAQVPGGDVIANHTDPFTVVYSPDITTLPYPSAINVGKSSSLTCDTDGEPQPTVSWWKHSLVHQQQPAMVSSSDTLKLTNVQCADMGYYVCVPENKIGSTERGVEVLVKCPPRENPNAPHVPIQYGRLNSPVNLILHVLSYRLPTFRWMIKGSDGTLESIKGHTVTQTDYGTSSRLSIGILERFGTYVVQVSNGILPNTEFEFKAKKVEVSSATHLTSSSDIVKSSTMVAVVVALVGVILLIVVLATVLRYKHKICKRTAEECEYESRNPELVDQHIYSEANSGLMNISMQPTDPEPDSDNSEHATYQNV